MKVQVVEDSTVVRQRLVAVLTEYEGTEVVSEAAGAAEAISAFRQRRPELVILDLQLADGSGFDVLRHARQQQPPPRVMVLTNYAYPEFREKCLSGGADFFFDKAADFERVLDVLEELLDQERNQERLASLPGSRRKT